VLDVPESQIEPPPRVSQSAGSRFIQGLGKVGETVKILLDVNKLLFTEELEMVGASAE
jgi:purine-binding chemotaxis protein CheW